MGGRHPILKGLGALFVLVLVFFSASFFYAYLTGGDPKALSLFSGDGVAIVEIAGAIEDSREVVAELKRFRDAPWIKAIVVRIDSPGGAVGPTQEIFDELQKARKKKPVVASMGGMATSGGYYIASACDQIVANAGTLTGSIGVIMQLSNVEELMKKIGIKGYSIKSGPNKDIGSPFQPLSPEGRTILQGLIDNVHGQFVAAVAKGRGMEEGEVRKLADGRVYSGAQAKQLGLVDHLGNLEYAIDLAARRGGLEEEPAIYYSQPEQERWWERLFMLLTGRRLGRGELGWLRYEWSPALLQ
ncbi:MAG TPA: signal peptide peptidase SppA [candidate division Zixibacteria bacterium]|nr:signal peptide peptidase SppA [candidate division Zixibacteria bacterium]